VTAPALGRWRAAGWFAGVVVTAAACGTVIGVVAKTLAGNRMAPWIVGRSSGICAYLLLVTLVLTGLTLSGGRRRTGGRVRGMNRAGRIRTHLALAGATAAAVITHVVALATDTYAGVGWHGVFVPRGASYRPVATTLGVAGLWIGVLSGLTGLAAGRLPGRLWWPVHKIAVLALAATWAHGVFGGGDTAALLPLYLGTGALVAVRAPRQARVSQPRRACGSSRARARVRVGVPRANRRHSG
jgi:hypothetical protein